jgi:23S rRNA (adenine2503-C2)-methyltransferase
LKYIYDVSPAELDEWLAARNYPAYRSRQIRQWLGRGVESVDDLTDIPLQLRRDLAASFDCSGLALLEARMSELDETVRYTFQLTDGNVIESVFMRYRRGTSVCVSSQAGCRMGCLFCASTGAGFGRNLTMGEMAAQVALVGKERKTRIDHVTVMGIGEPLENFDALIGFLQFANSPRGLNIGMRRITVSTCGLVPEIQRLAELQLGLTLAVSLHAPEDDLRARLMPIARRWPLADLMAVCRLYQQKTGRRMTYEYALFDGVNDHPEQARRLIALLQNQLCHVNLIPANAVEQSGLRRSSRKRIEAFQHDLSAGGIECTVRRELGSDIAAACGQLRRNRTL